MRMLALLSIFLALPLPALAVDCCVGPTVCDSICNHTVYNLGVTGTGYATESTELPGGIYGGYSNTMPGSHMAKALTAAGEIYPRDANGARDDTNGKIGVLFIGNSNHKQYADSLISRIAADGTKRTKLVTANGCGSGRTIERIRLAADGYWGAFPASSIAFPDSACDSTGLDPDQVQVVLMQNTAIDSTSFGRRKMADSCSMWVQGIAVILKSEFPKVQLFYFDGIQYTGRDAVGAPEVPEPIMGYVMSFVPGLALRGQMVSQWCTYANAPVILPGCSPWRDGIGVGTGQGGLTWASADFSADGIHPSATGRSKFATHFFNTMRTDPIWSLWYQNRVYNMAAANRATPLGGKGMWQ